ncbi:MAG: sigma-54-dependent Fis family transcriptional regulator [Deltaproteobacteria bacterium]|nr:sigma-54-dependent Fis family transcriptional regulator [Deltaproteobacteria bacterium]
MSASVLVVDDEPVFRVMAEEALSADGFDVRTASTLARARSEVDRTAPDVVILDRRLPDGDGIDFLPVLRASGSSAPLVIVVTAYGDVENAVDALRAGAWDYLTKPVQLTDLVVKLRKAIEARGLRDRLALAKSSAAQPSRVEPRSAAMREVVSRISSVAQSPTTPVFLTGPSGAGKQYAAELLHALTYQATDADAPFVELNCAAIPEELLESELFGHEKGAFTDAKTARRGLVELADGGTLFLDEVTELPLRSQAKLLKFLDTMTFRRLGSERERSVRLRVVAATNRNLHDAGRAERLREDLFHRLAVFVVAIPSLAERGEDIAELTDSFVEFFAGRLRKNVRGLTTGARAALAHYGYPGQVRELRNIIERAMILARGPLITEDDLVLPGSAAASPARPGFFVVELGEGGAPPELEQVEREYVGRVLGHLGGRRMAAAQALGVSYPTFLKRLRELGLEREDKG